MEIPTDCLHCGVCCFSKSGAYVRVSERDWERLGGDADRWARRIGGQGYMRMEDGHCIALQVTTPRGAPPRFFCEIYESRPQVCRDLARGREACRTELRAKAARVAALGGPLWGTAPRMATTPAKRTAVENAGSSTGD